MGDSNERVAERTSSQIRELSALYAEEVRRVRAPAAVATQVDFAQMAEQAMLEVECKRSPCGLSCLTGVVRPTLQPPESWLRHAKSEAA